VTSGYVRGLLIQVGTSVGISEGELTSRQSTKINPARRSAEEPQQQESGATEGRGRPRAQPQHRVNPSNLPRGFQRFGFVNPLRAGGFSDLG